MGKISRDRNNENQTLALVELDTYTTNRLEMIDPGSMTLAGRVAEHYVDVENKLLNRFNTYLFFEFDGCSNFCLAENIDISDI